MSDIAAEWTTTTSFFLTLRLRITSQPDPTYGSCFLRAQLTVKLIAQHVLPCFADRVVMCATLGTLRRCKAFLQFRDRTRFKERPRQ